MDTFKKEMEHALFLLFKGRLEVIENITVLEVRSNSIMKFHVLAKDEDSEELKLTIEQMLKLGKLGSFDFDHDYQEIYFEPALRIERVEASETMPIAEGTELVLACIIQGSSEMRVEWLRDGFPIHIHTAERSMWTTIVPKNSQDQYTVLLGFDRVASLDTGVFTCQVSDWGFVRNRSIYVRVLSAPQPQLSPITATVPLGSSHIITCLSSEDIYRNFGYTWLKNGRVLNPSVEPEMAEDLFPTGSRILLQEAAASATYSCIITSSAGSTRKDSFVTVIDKARSSPCCQPEDYLKVRWTMTASNTENIQLCPTGYTGDVRRKCVHDSNTNSASWGEPDFSGCFSSGFLSLRKKITNKTGAL
ncbi:hemicentin-2-like [Stegodyphus dumicola]|uniref:hemicentin-2-like n=1 Tax=Stegodyphus dumicola TaxID=202533 RepID=UPI0015AB4303|nr:hemicentin-2-like [Stegodyphus dumicola]